MGRVRPASVATGAFGGAPQYATQSMILCRNGRETACERRDWGLRWSPRWGHETREGCAETGLEPHANVATGVFGGTPDGAGAEMVWEPHAHVATGAFDSSAHGTPGAPLERRVNMPRYIPVYSDGIPDNQPKSERVSNDSAE